MKVKWINAKESKPKKDGHYLTVLCNEIFNKGFPFVTLLLYEDDKWQEDTVLFWFNADDLLFYTEYTENWKSPKYDKDLLEENKFYLTSIILETYSYGIKSYENFVGLEKYKDGKFNLPSENAKVLHWMETPEMPEDINSIFIQHMINKMHNKNNTIETYTPYTYKSNVSDKLEGISVVLPEKIKEYVTNIKIRRYTDESECDNTSIYVSDIKFDYIEDNCILVSKELSSLLSLDEKDIVKIMLI